jgi:hypothetical protein
MAATSWNKENEPSARSIAAAAEEKVKRKKDGG